jgi:hypothetical protein
VVIPYISKFPIEEKKVLIGDNLSAHLSPHVTDGCEEWNIRYLRRSI